MNKPIHTSIAAVDRLEQQLPGRVLRDPFTREQYARDDGPRGCLPLAVAFPTSHDEVATLVEVANEFRIPLVARGAGSGNVGGALPVPGSVVVSFECMSRIVEFDSANRIMIVEAGVITGEIDRLARTRGLFYPPDPGSAAYCRIGGNIAMNAGGPRAIKYGVTRDYVLGLRAVAGDGRALVTGCRTTKGVVGYDFTRLLVGSEGTLALITEATLRLVPAPSSVGTLRACFSNTQTACQAVERVMAQTVVPSALEFMDAASLNAIRRAASVIDVPGATRALLMIEADGDPDTVARELTALSDAVKGEGLVELRRAEDANEAAALWRARHSLSSAVKTIAPYKINEDVVVPMTRLAEALARFEELGAQYHVPIVSFGHAGNGNLHVNLMVHPDDADEMNRARACLSEIFKMVLALGGTLSGEHGIGFEKRNFVPLEIPPDTLALMQAIRRQFDPNGILNPGKALPDE
jgi:D-lactate dehydrogenase